MLRLQIQIQGKLIRLTIRNYIANKVHVCVCGGGGGGKSLPWQGVKQHVSYPTLLGW